MPARAASFSDGLALNRTVAPALICTFSPVRGFRPVRFGVSPLFLTYAGVWDAMDALADILASKSWDQPQFHARAKVT